MRLSVPLSFLLHAALLLWSYGLFIATKPDDVAAPEAIAISMITPSELLRLKQGDVNSTELEAKAKEEPPTEMSVKEADKPKPVEGPPPAAEPPPPQEEAKPPEPEPPKVEEAKPAEPAPADPIAEKLAALPPEPAPGPTPEELKKAEDEKQAEDAKKAEEAKKVEDEKKAEEKKKEDDKKKAEEKKRKEKEKQKKLAEAKKKKEDELKKQKASEADRLAALLDKTPDKRGAKNAAAPPESETDYTGPTAGAEKGNDTRLSATDTALLVGRVRSQLVPCWRLPGGGGGIETTVVVVKWRLRPDGTLDGEPTLDGSYTDPVQQIAADAALRAVRGCAPFDLPADKYKFWHTITFRFDPREMMGMGQ